MLLIPLVYVEDYESRLSPVGLLTEKIVYVVDEPGHYMIYRSWDTSVRVKGKGVYIEPVSIACPEGFVSYIYGGGKELVVPPGTPKEIIDRLRSKLE